MNTQRTRQIVTNTVLHPRDEYTNNKQTLTETVLHPGKT